MSELSRCSSNKVFLNLGYNKNVGNIDLSGAQNDQKASFVVWHIQGILLMLLTIGAEMRVYN